MSSAHDGVEIEKTQTSSSLEESTAVEQIHSIDEHADSISKEIEPPEKREKKPRYYENGMLKTSPNYNSNRRNNRKYDPSVLPESEDPQEIRNQVEFYFGDTNLPKDDHMWEQTDGTKNLPIKIAHICTFGRMKRFKSLSAVVAALRKSEFLEVSGAEGSEEVKRKVPYDPTTRSKSEPRSIYAKGFGDEEPSTQFDIEAFFSPYGPINSVRLRRTEDNLFKGSVFVEFQDITTAEKFLALEPKPLWKGEHVLLIKSKKQYVHEKGEDIRGGRIVPGPTDRSRGRGKRDNRSNCQPRGGHRNSRDLHQSAGEGARQGDRDPDDWKKRREDDRANGNGFSDSRSDRNNRGGRGHGRGRDRGRGRGREPSNVGRDEAQNERKSDGGSLIKQQVTSAVDNGKESTSTSNAETASDAKATDFPAEGGKKRGREDDEGSPGPSKKIDHKSNVETNPS